jgi:thiamine-phosphate pyrophosphorylase
LARTRARRPGFATWREINRLLSAKAVLARVDIVRPGLTVTAAAHSMPALIRARRAGADAALLSAVFQSRSPSAGRPLGPMRFADLVRRAGLPVYALGGVKTKNAPRLLGSGAAGLAMVEGLAEALDA